MQRLGLLSLGALLAGSACAPGSSAAPPVGPASGALEIETSPVTLRPGQEEYVCWSAALPPGVAPALSRADFEAPSQGLHHYGIYWSGSAPADAPPGPYECSEMQLGWIFFGGGGAGDSSLVFPPGTGMPLSAGSQIVFQYHLVNATGAPLTVPAGSARVTFLPEGSTYTPAAPLTVASFAFEIPPESAGYDVDAGCTVPFDLAHVFSVFPHLHQWGTHVTVSAAPRDGGVAAPLYAGDWTPGVQAIYPLDRSIAAGSRVSIDCLYDNAATSPVEAAQTAEGEMCLAVLYYAPAQAPEYHCGF